MHIIFLIVIVGIIGFIGYVLSLGIILAFCACFEFCEKHKIGFLIFIAIVICYLAINNYTPKPKKKSLSDTVISVTASSPPLNPLPLKTL
jgi:hypothetical protein